MSNISFLQELLTSVADQSRHLLPKALFRDDPEQGLQDLIKALMSGRGEASGVAIARQLLRHYQIMNSELRLAFFRYIGEELKPDPQGITAAATSYIEDQSAENLEALQAAVDSPTQEFFRRLNMAPGGTADIVRMRKDLLDFMRAHPEHETLRTTDSDLQHLLQSWFNRGFLVLRRIDWHTPATILDKIIAYEAVHEITGWSDLKRRLEPADRRCFAFFHPSLVDEPLIFVQVALTQEIPGEIANVLETDDGEATQSAKGPTTAVFYSISNCQQGLRGISFGNFLIKQVVEELSKECPSLKTFVTLSPVPGFAKWVNSIDTSPENETIDDNSRSALVALKTGDWQRDQTATDALEPSVQALAAMYFLNEKNRSGQPLDPVARFHLGNGARLERINWPADLSQRGLKQAHGLMVNYLYELADIERNHEAYAHDGTVAAARTIRNQIKNRPKLREPVASKPKADETQAPPSAAIAHEPEPKKAMASDQE